MPKIIVEYGNKNGMHSSHSFSSIKQATKFAASIVRVLANSKMFSGCDDYDWRLEQHQWRIEWVSKSHFVALSRTNHEMGSATSYLWQNPETFMSMKTRTIYEQHYPKGLPNA